MVHFYWIPESPEFPGIYANLSGYDMCTGKIICPLMCPSTRDVNRARKFNSFAECEEWCKMNPKPVFVPKEHGFCTGIEDFA